MIDATTARAIENIDARTRDLSSEFVSGYIPQDDAEATASGVRAVRSLDPMDAVAPEHAFYVGEDAQGRRFYSRDGALSLRDGRLCARDGSAILGFPADGASARPVALAADPVDVALGRVSEPHVEADGTVVYARTAIDPKTGEPKQERVALGRIALARFPAGTQIVAADGVHVTAPAGVEPVIGTPGNGDFGALLPQSRDLGGIDMQKGLTHLRDAYLAFSAMQSAKGARGKTDKVAMDLVK